MKRFVLFLLKCLFPMVLGAQTASCLEVVAQLDKYSNEYAQKIDYILAHKGEFDMQNSYDKWLFNLFLGTSYYYTQRYEEAVVCFREVTAFYEDNVNEIDFRANPQLLAIYYYEATCEFYIGASKDTVISKLNKAKSVYEKNQLEQTEIYSQIVYGIKCVEADIVNKLSLLINLKINRKYHEAIPLFEQIIPFLQKQLPIETIASYNRLLANCYMEVGRINDAESLYLRTLAELKETDKQGTEAYRYICNCLVDLYCRVYNYKKAEDISKHCKYLYEQSMDFGLGYIKCLSNYAVVESNLGRILAAKMLIDVALSYCRDTDGYNRFYELLNTNQPLLQVSGWDLESSSFKNNAQIFYQWLPYIRLLSNASAIYQNAGFWDDAVMCLKECIALCDSIGEPDASAYNNLGMLYLSQSRISESLPYFAKSVSLCKTEDEMIEKGLNYAFALYLHSSNSDSIATYVSKSLTNNIVKVFSFLSQEERFNYYKHIEFYFPLLNLMIYAGDKSQYGQIYDNILVSKGLLLRAANDVKQVIMSSGDDELISKFNRMIELRQNLQTEVDATLRMNISRDIEVLDKELSKRADAYGAFTQWNNTKWQDVREVLHSEDIAIEFYNIPIIYQNDTIQKMDGEPRYCAVLLKKDYVNPVIIPLCKESELSIIDEDSLYTSEILYKLIWKPIEAELKGVHNVYFAADRILHNTAVEYALLQDGRRMNDLFNMYRLSSTRRLVEKRRTQKPLDAVLYGGLKYDVAPEQLIAESRAGDYHSKNNSRSISSFNLRYGVKYLPGTKEEVQTIYNSFAATPKAKCRIITDVEGTEESFKSLASKNVGIIHLATHGFYWGEEETENRSYVSFLSRHREQSAEDRALQSSGLFFSGANIGLSGKELPEDVEDGILTAKELSTMNLGNVDLVVMSTCQSGLGETSIEGVFGLQRGFKLAGANTLLMSLWKVDDIATKELMTNFYHYYLLGKSKLESLKLAQQSIRNQTEFSSPEYWAGFILLDAL